MTDRHEQDIALSVCRSANLVKRANTQPRGGKRGPYTLILLQSFPSFFDPLFLFFS